MLAAFSNSLSPSLNKTHIHIILIITLLHSNSFSGKQTLMIDAKLKTTRDDHSYVTCSLLATQSVIFIISLSVLSLSYNSQRLTPTLLLSHSTAAVTHQCKGTCTFRHHHYWIHRLLHYLQQP